MTDTIEPLPTPAPTPPVVINIDELAPRKPRIYRVPTDLEAK